MRFDRIIIFLMVLSIFLDDFIIGYSSNEARAASSFDFYYYYLIFFVFLFAYLVKIKRVPWLPSWFLMPLLILFAASIVTGFLQDTLRFAMAKQIIGISFSAIAYFNLYQFSKYNLERLFKIYLNIAFFVALYGIIEEVLLLRGYYHLFDNVKLVSVGYYRVYSIMGEPYFLSVALIPAVYYYISNLFNRRIPGKASTLFRLSVILLCYILTFSSAGIIALGIMLSFVLYNHGYFNPTNIRFILLAVVLFFFMPDENKLFSMKEFKVRMEDSYSAFTKPGLLDKKDIAKLNSSTFALYSNFIIAQKSFEKNPITGSGLGSHEITYDDHFGNIFGKKFMIMYGNFNQKDGNSLFIRLLSETGILGLLLIFIFMFRFLLSRKNFHNLKLTPFIIMNQAVFIVMIIRLMRTGNYIGQGFFFFFFLYYFTYKAVKEQENLPQEV